MCVLVWLAVVGCSGPSTVVAEQFPAAFVKASCQRAQECCTTTAPAPRSATQQTDCEVNSDFAAALMGDLGRAVSERRAAYDPQNAERCLEQIRQAGCTMRLDVARPDVAGDQCALAVRGLVNAGSPCQSGWDCVPGAFCDGPWHERHCVTRLPEAAACMRDDQCATGECRDGHCQGRPPMCPAP